MLRARRAWPQDVTRAGTGTIEGCRIGSVLDGHRTTADDQRMPEGISETSTPPSLPQLGFGDPPHTAQREV